MLETGQAGASFNYFVAKALTWTSILISNRENHVQRLNVCLAASHDQIFTMHIRLKPAMNVTGYLRVNCTMAFRLFRTDLFVTPSETELLMLIRRIRRMQYCKQFESRKASLR